MRILSIETSCDETAISIMEFTGDADTFTATVLGDALYSQVHTHQPFGGVVPMLAKREHAQNAVPLMHKALKDAGLLVLAERSLAPDTELAIRNILNREHGLAEALLTFLTKHTRPELDAIAVTHGPGLEPALWVGLNFAKALSVAWDVPLAPMNHMEGHVIGSMVEKVGEDVYAMRPIAFPVLGLLISGNHTELVLLKRWIDFNVVGTTRDDAVGEAYDKVARMLGLPYPGGVHLSTLAEQARRTAHVLYHHPATIQCNLPRPMMHSPDCDFSFSGLKTAVLYILKGIPTLTPEMKQKIAREFEDSVAEVLIAKTKRALSLTGARTFIIGGGVSANTHIRRRFEALMSEEYPDIPLYVPEKELTGDNAIMIGLAAYVRLLTEPDAVIDPMEVRAEGNLKLSTHRLSMGTAE